MKSYSKHPKVVLRRKGAKSQLETQLRLKTKRVGLDILIPLDEKDVFRIKREITILNERI